MLFNGTQKLLCAHFLIQEAYSSLGAISQSEAWRNTFCCFGISQIIRSFPHPSPVCHDFLPSARFVTQTMGSEATGGYRRPRTAGGQQASSRELGHQNAINLGHFNLLWLAIFVCQPATTTYVAALQ
jgi:hypothetical protein